MVVVPYVESQGDFGNPDPVKLLARCNVAAWDSAEQPGVTSQTISSYHATGPGAEPDPVSCTSDVSPGGFPCSARSSPSW